MHYKSRLTTCQGVDPAIYAPDNALGAAIPSDTIIKSVQYLVGQSLKQVPLSSGNAPPADKLHDFFSAIYGNPPPPLNRHNV